jgi:hypothetical protein
MTKQELNELKRLAKFFWSRARLLEKAGDNRLHADSGMNWIKNRAQADSYRHASTLLSLKLEKLQGNKSSGNNSPKGKRVPEKS